MSRVAYGSAALGFQGLDLFVQGGPMYRRLQGRLNGVSKMHVPHNHSQWQNLNRRERYFRKGRHRSYILLVAKDDCGGDKMGPSYFV